MKVSYERQEGESKQAYEAFTVYRNLGITRSLKEVANQLGKHRSLIERWSKNNNWVDRAQVFDDEMDRRAILQNEQERKEMIIKHTEIARRMLEKVKIAVEALNPETLTANEIVKLFEIAVKIERLSRGESTDVSEITHSGDATGTMDEQDVFKRVEQYAAVYKKLAKAE